MPQAKQSKRESSAALGKSSPTQDADFEVGVRISTALLVLSDGTVVLPWCDNIL
jgi:hypothetical protein